MERVEIEIPKKVLRKLYDNCNHGGMMCYDREHKVGKYQLVDSWEEKETGLFVPGYLLMIIKDLETKKYYQNKSTWLHHKTYERYCFDTTKCIEVKKIETLNWELVEK